MSCWLTGLPPVMCAHCSGITRNNDVERLPRRKDDSLDPNPRWVRTSGKGKSRFDPCVKWVGAPGLIVPLEGNNAVAMEDAAGSGSRRGNWTAKSEWARTQIARTLRDMEKLK